MERKEESMKRGDVLMAFWTPSETMEARKSNDTGVDVCAVAQLRNMTPLLQLRSH